MTEQLTQPISGSQTGKREASMIAAQAAADSHLLRIKIVGGVIFITLIAGVALFFYKPEQAKEYNLFFGQILTGCLGFLFGQRQKDI